MNSSENGYQDKKIFANLFKETDLNEKSTKLNHIKKNLVDFKNIDANNDDGIYVKKRASKDDKLNNNKKFSSSSSNSNLKSDIN